MFQVIIWWIYGAITKQAICRFVCIFSKGVMSKAISFYISSRINKTWYKLTVLFGSFEIGPNSWLNWHVGS